MLLGKMSADITKNESFRSAPKAKVGEFGLSQDQIYNMDYCGEAYMIQPLLIKMKNPHPGKRKPMKE